MIVSKSSASIDARPSYVWTGVLNSQRSPRLRVRLRVACHTSLMKIPFRQPPTWPWIWSVGGMTVRGRPSMKSAIE